MGRRNEKNEGTSFFELQLWPLGLILRLWRRGLHLRRFHSSTLTQEPDPNVSDWLHYCAVVHRR